MNLSVLNTLGLLGTLKEGNLENIATSGSLAEKVRSIRVPSNGEGIVPATKKGISRLKLEQCLALAASELGCRNVANDIGEVRVNSAHLERHSELLQSSRGRIIEGRLRILDSIERRRQVGTTMVQSVSFLKRNIASPMADLDIAFQGGNVGHGLGKLESNLSRRHGSSWLLTERTVCELGTLLLR